MTQPITRTCNVVIVRLGPTGAVLANLLGQYGWNIAAIERDVDLYYAPGAVHFDSELMRIFQFAGLAEDIGRTSESFKDMDLLLEPGGKPVMTTQIGSLDRHYGYPGAWRFHQSTLKGHFHQGLKRFPNVTALYGYHPASIKEHADAVEVGVECLATQTKQIVRGANGLGRVLENVRSAFRGAQPQKTRLGVAA